MSNWFHMIYLELFCFCCLFLRDFGFDYLPSIILSSAWFCLWLQFQHLHCSANHHSQNLNSSVVLGFVWFCFIRSSLWTKRLSGLLSFHHSLGCFSFCIDWHVESDTRGKWKSTCRCWWRTDWGCWPCTSWRPAWAGCHSGWGWTSTLPPPSGRQKKKIVKSYVILCNISGSWMHLFNFNCLAWTDNHYTGANASIFNFC